MIDPSSVRYALQASNAIPCASSLCCMLSDDIQEFRRRRLREAVDFVCLGNENHFGRLLGYKDGAFIRQMLGESKSITEKTVAKVEQLPGLEGWFSVNASVNASAALAPEAVHGFVFAKASTELEAAPALRPTRDVPVVGDVRGGDNGYFEEYQYPAGHGDGLIAYPTKDANAYAVRVRGDSMHPRYRAGEFIVVEPGVEAQPGEDVVVRCRDGRKLLKVLAWVRDGQVSLLSINNGHPPLTLEADEVESIHPVAGSVPARALQKR